MALWTPAEITTALWLDAADSDTITIDTGVSGWADKSGNARHATQATGSAQPAYNSTSKRIEFTSSNSHNLILASQPFTGTTPRTVFAIVTSTTYGSTGGGYFSASDNATAADGRLWDLCIESGGFYIRLAGNDYFTPTPSINTLSLIAAQWESGLSSNSSVWHDGTALSWAGGSSRAINTLAGDAYLGHTYIQPDKYFDGYLHEIIIISGTLSTTDRKKIEGYLAHKWGLADNLPADHPYKDAAPIATYAEKVLGDNPINYWRLGDGADADYDNVKLLLPMHGVNSGNSFVDQSPTPKTVSVSSAITSTEQSKFYGSSGYFNGSSYLTVPASTDFQVDDDFTFETWLYLPASITNYAGIIVDGDPTSSGITFALYFNASNQISCYLRESSSTFHFFIEVASEAAITNETWHHISVSISKADNKVYTSINGVVTEQEIVTPFTTTAAPTFPLQIGRYSNTQYFTGYLQDLRISKGVARYTENFTPKRLSRLAIDEMGEHDLTWSGTPTYGATGVILADTDTAMSLDGSTDYASKAVSGYRSGDATGSIEFWVKFSAIANYHTIFCSADNALSSYYFAIIISNGYLGILQRSADTAQSTYMSGDALAVDTWYHCVVTSSGTAYKMYVNGEDRAVTGEDNGDWLADTANRDSLALGVLYHNSLSNYFSGTLDEVAVYDYALTPEQILEHYQAGIYEPETVEHILRYWKEPYNIGYESLTVSFLEIYNNISSYIALGYTEPMAYALLASFREPYRSTPQRLAYWLEPYPAAPEYIRSFTEPYISAAELLSFWREGWQSQPAILAAWTEPYQIADTTLLVSITEPYSLEEMSQLMPYWREQYAMTIGSSLYQRVSRVH